MFTSLPLFGLIGLYLVAAAVVWKAGVTLASSSDVLSERLHLGQALGGLILLALATNLPEIAITISAAINRNPELAIGNILGGIGIQTVVLVVLDRVVQRSDGPLMSRARSLVVTLECLIVMAVLATVVMAAQLQPSVSVIGLGPGAVVVALVWIVGLRLIQRAKSGLPWKATGSSQQQSNDSDGESNGKMSKRSTSRVALAFAVASLATLASGYVLEESGAAAATDVGLSGVLFGATVLALATSLPELSTGIASVRRGRDELAISDILGGNAFLPVLFVLLSLLLGKPALPNAQPSDLYLAALGIVLSAIYAAGSLFRSARKPFGIGVDSLAVLLVYLLAIVGLVVVRR